LGVLFVAVCSLVLCGCGDEFDVAPVSGKVTLDGKPLPDVEVNFQPRGGGGVSPGPGSTGITDAEGRYTLKTSEESPKEGAVPGKHIVTMTLVLAGDADSDAVGGAGGGKLPAECGDGSLTFEVTPEGTDSADFDLKSP